MRRVPCRLIRSLRLGRYFLPWSAVSLPGAWAPLFERAILKAQQEVAHG